jgi:hypothetical protein
MYFGRPIVSFNSLYVNRELTRIPDQATTVHFHLTERVTLIDHTASTNLMHFVRDYEQSGRGRIQFTGLKEMHRCSEDEACVRLGTLALAGADGGGISALLTKVRHSMFRTSEPAPWISPVDDRAVVGPPHFASSAEDLRWLSLSSDANGCSADKADVSVLGEAPDYSRPRDPRGDLARMSLS